MVQVNDGGKPEAALSCYDQHCELLEPALGSATSGQGWCWNDDKMRRGIRAAK
uniref:Uncharacterized protein n=1 Tax=Aegilops tauschii TaxID=37682 RepID=M8BLB4_AEGTA